MNLTHALLGDDVIVKDIATNDEELKSGKWLLGAICLQLATGFSVGFLVYQIGTLLTTGSLGSGFAGGLIAFALFAMVIISLIVKANRNIGLES